MANSSSFTSSDTWVLLAAVYGGAEKGADLDAIISAGDYINHAILSYEELDGGLARLQAANLIEERNGLYFLTPIVLSAYEGMAKRHRSVSKRWDALEQFLKEGEHQAQLGEALNHAVTRTAYEHAVQAYLHRFTNKPSETSE